MNEQKIRKYKLFDIDIGIVSYESAVKIIIDEAKEKNSFGVTALAVHGLMLGVLNPNVKSVLANIDMIVPDGHPIKWSLNLLYGAGLNSNVRGANLTLKVCEAAEKDNIPIYFYGSSNYTINKMFYNLKIIFPKINIVGVKPDRFKELSKEEDFEDIKEIEESGARIVFRGNGCPRQEKWISEHKGKINAVMLGVGAAFDFIAKNKKEAPIWMQNNGLEWLFRFINEPHRLWKRYLLLNPIFIVLLVRDILYIKILKKRKEN